jgi:hypothetical protein
VNSSATTSRPSNFIVAAFVITFIIFLYKLVPAPSLPEFGAPMSIYFYPLLTKGVLSGHLSLAIPPSHELLSLKNPYNPFENGCCREMFDASFYKEKYYLYFGPLPLIFYVPFTLLTGKIATQYVGVIFFLSLAFIVNFSLLIKIRNKYFAQISNAQLILAGLVLGLTNNSMFLLARPSFYENALTSAFCFMSLALFFLYSIFNESIKIRNVCLFGLCLSLSIAGRPHFFLVCAVLVPVVFVYLVKNVVRMQLAKFMLALFIPVISVGVMLALYNYLRFDSIFEFGQHYQISDTNRMLDHSTSASLQNWGRGLYYYFFSPTTLTSSHWVGYGPKNLRLMKFLGSVTLTNPTFYTVGYVKSIFLTVPVTLFIFALPLILFKQSQIKLLTKFIAVAFLVPLTNIIFLVSLPTVTQRYETDFLPYLILISLLVAWSLDKTSLPDFTKHSLQLLFILTEFISVGLAFQL